MAAILGKLEGLGSSLAQKGQGVLDSVFPPEKRAELLARIKTFVLKNPKISAFLLTNLALTGGPLALFVLFSLSIFIFALLVALIVGLLAAVAFTLFMVGVALLIVLPTVFFTTMTATFLFLWGLGGYYIFKHFNKNSAPGAKGDTIGDKLNALTGNRLDFAMDATREGWVERQLGDKQGDWKEPSPHHAKTNGTTPNKSKDHDGHSSATTSGSDAKKHGDSPSNGVKSGVDGVKKNVNPDKVTGAANGVTKTAGVGDAGEKVKGAPKKLGSAPGQLKGTAVGTVGGATGLA